MKRHGLNSAGFTLVEALISLALVAVMLSMLPASLQLGRRAWQGTIAIEARQRADVVSDLVRRKIAAAVPAFGRGPAGVHQLAFTGRSNSISFVVDEVEEGMSGYVRYEIEEDAGTRRLVMRRMPFEPFARQPAAASPSEVVLASNVTAFSLRYLGSSPPIRGTKGSGPQWQTEWVARDVLPTLVEVDISSPTLGGPAIVAEIKLN